MTRSCCLALALACAGCQAGIDVTYSDAGTGSPGTDGSADAANDGTLEASADAGADTAIDASPADGPTPRDAAPDTTPGDDGGCPCDTTAGLGCCIPSAGTPFCTDDGQGCAGKGGAFAFCTGYDGTTDSTCCWNGASGKGGTTSYAGACGARATSCGADSDCVAATCAKATCNGIVLGACGATAPVCP